MQVSYVLSLSLILGVCIVFLFYICILVFNVFILKLVCCEF